MIFDNELKLLSESFFKYVFTKITWVIYVNITNVIVEIFTNKAEEIIAFLFPKMQSDQVLCKYQKVKNVVLLPFYHKAKI